MATLAILGSLNPNASGCSAQPESFLQHPPYSSTRKQYPCLYSAIARNGFVKTHLADL